MLRSFFSTTSLFIILALALGSCKKDDVTPEPLETVTKDLLVDAKNDGAFTLFNFETGQTVASDRQNSTEWDFGLRLTTFIVNSGASGPGNGAAMVTTGVFNEISTAPETGFKADATGDLAITDGSWYDYNPITRSFAPKAGIVFLFRTAKGNYAKMEIVSAAPTDDNGNVVVPPTQPTKIKYTVRYVYQKDGTRNF
jgi:hypothetical protein